MRITMIPEGPSHSYIFWTATGAEIEVLGTRATVHFTRWGDVDDPGSVHEVREVDLMNTTEVCDLYRRLSQKGTQEPECRATLEHVREAAGLAACPAHSFAWVCADGKCWYSGRKEEGK